MRFLHVELISERLKQVKVLSWGSLKVAYSFLLVTCEAKQVVQDALKDMGKQQRGSGCVFGLKHMGDRYVVSC